MGAELKGLEIAMGIGMGGALTGDVTGMIAAKNFTSAAMNSIKALREKAKSGPSVQDVLNAKSRKIEKINSLIDAYDSLQAKKGWDNDRMLIETERLLNINDTSKIRDDDLRSYAEAVQDYRKEFEGKYQVPNDMVLDTINKVQKKEVKKQPVKRKITRPKKK